MRTLRKSAAALLAAALVIGTAGCGASSGEGRTTAAAADTAETAAPVTTTTIDPNREIDLIPDYDEMADIGEVDTKNESGAGKLYDRREWKAHERRVRVGDVLFRPNYNDDPDPAVRETVEKLVDTSKAIELERIDLSELPKRRAFRFVKRSFDIVACSAALVICAIPMAVIAIVVKLDSPGPVFYVQERLGAYARPINVVKFRSMRTDAEAQGAQWARGEDPRVTKVGAFLRRTRLDEIPQFLAVVKW
mgnify:CR=1 FL=1